MHSIDPIEERAVMKGMKEGMRPWRSMVSAMEQRTGGGVGRILDVMGANTHRGPTTPIMGNNSPVPLL
jgi:hypothetical protein